MTIYDGPVFPGCHKVRGTRFSLRQGTSLLGATIGAVGLLAYPGIAAADTPGIADATTIKGGIQISTKYAIDTEIE